MDWKISHNLSQTLTKLNLRGCNNITDDGLKNLPQTLTKLNLRGCNKITAACAVSLETDDGLKNLPQTLTKLNLRWCNVTDNGLKNSHKHSQN